MSQGWDFLQAPGPGNSGFICFTLATSAGIAVKGYNGWGSAQKILGKKSLSGMMKRKKLKEDEVCLPQGCLCHTRCFRNCSDSGAEQGKQVPIFEQEH
jgi:hypothetical protein